MLAGWRDTLYNPRSYRSCVMAKLVQVEAYSTVSQADASKNYLEKNGIAAYVEDSEIIAMDWMLGAAVGGIKLKVAAADAQRATELLVEIKRSSKADPQSEPIVFACEECGKENKFPAQRAGGVETCVHCGRYVDVPEVELPDTEAHEPEH
ncbi:MAG: hypothetical protein Aurels2KO_51910 [Aureliella sp.]